MEAPARALRSDTKEDIGAAPQQDGNAARLADLKPGRTRGGQPDAGRSDAAEAAPEQQQQEEERRAQASASADDDGSSPDLPKPLI